MERRSSLSKKLTVPRLPQAAGEGFSYEYEDELFEFKVISDFALLSFKEIYALDEFTYYYLLRNAVIHQLSLTETGRQKLEEAWVLEQTRPDYSSLSKLQGKKGVEIFGFKD